VPAAKPRRESLTPARSSSFRSQRGAAPSSSAVATLGAGYRLGGRAYYASGRPYAYACPTPSCGPADPLAPRPFLVEGRFPDFVRADVRFEKRWELGEGRWLAAAFEWFNANMVRERDGLAWSPQRGGLTFTSRSPLTLPSLGIEGGF
jgi:hypothetical protein